MITADELDTLVEIQRKTRATGLMKAGKGTWATIDTVWAGIQDALPSRGEKLAEGIAVSRRPARLRIWHRDDVTADMRFKHGSRIMQIVAGPAVLGRRVGLEFMVEDYSTGGEAP